MEAVTHRARSMETAHIVPVQVFGALGYVIDSFVERVS